MAAVVGLQNCCFAMHSEALRKVGVGAVEMSSEAALKVLAVAVEGAYSAEAAAAAAEKLVEYCRNVFEELAEAVDAAEIERQLAGDSVVRKTRDWHQ